MDIYGRLHLKVHTSSKKDGGSGGSGRAKLSIHAARTRELAAIEAGRTCAEGSLYMRARALAQWRPDVYKWGRLKEVQLLNHPGVGSLLPPNRRGPAPLPASIHYRAKKESGVTEEQVV